MTRPGPSQHRQQILASEIRLALQQRLARGISDPRIAGLITLTRVEVPQDLKTAKVFFSVLPDKNEPKVLAALNHAANHLRREIGTTLDTDRLPHLTFLVDLGMKNQNRVIRALGQAAAERDPTAPDPADPVAQPGAEENNPGRP